MSMLNTLPPPTTNSEGVAKVATPETDDDLSLLTPQQREDVIVDEIGGVLWRHVYLKNEEMKEEHVLEFAQ